MERQCFNNYQEAIYKILDIFKWIKDIFKYYNISLFI